MPMFPPGICASEERKCTAKGIYDIDLAFKLGNKYQGNISRLIVKNDVSFDDGRIFILTGPNSGGKTTYLKAVGQMQLLFQLGMYVPAEEAYISPVDSIFTHFATPQAYFNKMGEFEEECSKIKMIFDSLTKNSMVLMNEPLITTTTIKPFISQKAYYWL